MSTIETSLTAVSAIDGRYSSYTSVLSEYFSEIALMKKRVFVEIEYLIKFIFKLHSIDNSLNDYNSKYCVQFLRNI